ncbi:MAG: phage tail tape measure protein, partial [Pseudomonadota bacterium]
MDEALAKLSVDIDARLGPLERDLRRVRADLTRFGQQTEREVTGRAAGSFRSLAGAATAAAAAVASVGAGVALASALRDIASFETSLRRVAAVTGATGQQLQDLEDTARQLGATTTFSAQEAALGLEFLGRAGFSAAEAIEAVPAALDLAAAGGIALGRAADIASNAVGAFGLAADDAGRVADVFASTAARSNTNVEQLAQALTTVGPIANSVGLSIEETAASIGVLGDSGLQATVAGTGLRGVLASLSDPSEELAAALGDVSLQADGLDGVLNALSGRGVSAAEAFQFFGREAAPAFQVLLQGRQRSEELAAELDNVSGEAQRLAENALGPLDRLGRTLSSVFSELTLQLGDSGLAEAAQIAGENLLQFARSEATADAVELLGSAILGLAQATSNFL